MFSRSLKAVPLTPEVRALTGLTALGALGNMRPLPRTIAAAMVAVPYLAASYFAQAAFKEAQPELVLLGALPGARRRGRQARSS